MVEQEAPSARLSNQPRCFARLPAPFSHSTASPPRAALGAVVEWPAGHPSHPASPHLPFRAPSAQQRARWRPLRGACWAGEAGGGGFRASAASQRRWRAAAAGGIGSAPFDPRLPASSPYPRAGPRQWHAPCTTRWCRGCRPRRGGCRLAWSGAPRRRRSPSPCPLPPKPAAAARSSHWLPTAATPSWPLAEQQRRRQMRRPQQQACCTRHRCARASKASTHTAAPCNYAPASGSLPPPLTLPCRRRGLHRLPLMARLPRRLAPPPPPLGRWSRLLGRRRACTPLCAHMLAAAAAAVLRLLPQRRHTGWARPAPRLQVC